MILYLDTSSLVKLYLDEPHSDFVSEWAESADIVATSRIAYPETLSAFTRRWSRGDLTDEEWGAACEAVTADWPSFFRVPVNENRAGFLVPEHLLRGFDAVHLAAACDLFDWFRSEDVVFSSFDARLLKAARASGLSIFHPIGEGGGSGFVMDSPEFPWALEAGRY
jgi:predicted nucleic acid-binding protein